MAGSSPGPPSSVAMLSSCGQGGIERERETEALRWMFAREKSTKSSGAPAGGGAGQAPLLLPQQWRTPSVRGPPQPFAHPAQTGKPQPYASPLPGRRWLRARPACHPCRGTAPPAGSPHLPPCSQSQCTPAGRPARRGKGGRQFGQGECAGAEERSHSTDGAKAGAQGPPHQRGSKVTGTSFLLPNTVWRPAAHSVTARSLPPSSLTGYFIRRSSKLAYSSCSLISRRKLKYWASAHQGGKAAGGAGGLGGGSPAAREASSACCCRRS